LQLNIHTKESNSRREGVPPLQVEFLALPG